MIAVHDLVEVALSHRARLRQLELERGLRALADGLELIFGKTGFITTS